MIPMNLARSTLLLAALFAASTAHADDPAVDELKAGYALKQASRCAEAVPHFVHSVQLAESAKALLNLADCEARLGNLVGARQHAGRGQALATERHDAELASVGTTLLASIDARLPKVTFTLAAGAPHDCAVKMDGVAVPLGAAEVVNPGEHTIVVTASGRADRSFPVVVAESASQTIDVGAGAPLTTATSVPDNQYEGATSTGHPVGTRSLLALGVGGVGVIGVVIGSVLGLSAISKNNASNANGHCDASGCDPTGVTLRHEALGQATASTVAFVLGLGAVAGGAVVFATAPRDHAAATRLELRPTLAPTGGGASLWGTW